jgi:hypothetical protein
MTIVHLCGHLDPMETIGTRGAQGHNHLEEVVTKTNGNVLVVVGDGKLRH